MTRPAHRLLTALGLLPALWVLPARVRAPSPRPSGTAPPEYFYLEGQCEGCTLDAAHPTGAYWLVSDSVYEGVPDHFDAYVESYRRTLERWFVGSAPAARTVEVRRAATVAEAGRARAAEWARMRARGYEVIEVPYHPSVE